MRDLLARHRHTLSNRQLADLLEEAGFMIGTAYQLADDILDVYGEESESGKTLGTDATARKVTAVSAWLGDTSRDPVAEIGSLCERSVAVLDEYPEVACAWRRYLDNDLRPAIDRHVESFEALATT